MFKFTIYIYVDFFYSWFDSPKLNMVNISSGKTKDGVKVVDTLRQFNKTLQYDEFKYKFYILFLLPVMLLGNFE